MANEQIVSLNLGAAPVGATHFNLYYSQDGGVTYLPFSTSQSSPAAPEDLSVGLLSGTTYTLDGINGPTGNMAAASQAGNLLKARWKTAGGYGNPSVPVVEVRSLPSPGWPTTADVIQKIEIAAPDGLNIGVTADLEGLLDAVIAEFQSPVEHGGTGRRFTPLQESRTYDGSGFPELRVDDLVPQALGGTALSITANAAAITGVVPRRPVDSLGWCVLMRPQENGATYNVFPTGRQNIVVNATWGFAATVPTDVWEAIRGEVAARALRQSEVALDGVGDMVQLGPLSMNTSAGISVWEASSPLALFQKAYQECIRRYRDERATWERFTAGLPVPMRHRALR